jgi:hypothetical protein
MAKLVKSNIKLMEKIKKRRIKLAELLARHEAEEAQKEWEGSLK